MAVPDTTTFSLQDVVSEINPTTDDLLDCVSDASSGSYDGTYYTNPATSLLEFRNYGASAATIVVAVSGNNFLVNGATAFQGFQIEFEFVSQTDNLDFGGTPAVVKKGGSTVSVGATDTINTVGGPGNLWNADPGAGSPFTVTLPLGGQSTIVWGVKINSTTVDTFPTGQVTMTRVYQGID
jgi:hypothetical protein